MDKPGKTRCEQRGYHYWHDEGNAPGHPTEMWWSCDTCGATRQTGEDSKPCDSPDCGRLTWYEDGFCEVCNHPRNLPQTTPYSYRPASEQYERGQRSDAAW